jgi:hypothetical protein
VATLQDDIAERFLKRLSESEHFDPKRLAQLKQLLAKGEKLKVDELVKLLSLPAGGDLT